MTAKTLCVVICDTVAGELSLSDAGTLSFRYDAAYDGTPLSLSMPVSNRTYPQKVVLPYLEGLLPDDEGVRRAIASRFDVGPNNAFALLSHIGLFTAMLFFDCLIGAPDAHAKNYSIILRGKDRALLAPLYDVASGLPYESLRRKGRLAMGVGGENRFGRMSSAALERYARNGHLKRAGFDAVWCTGLMLGLAGRIERNAGPLFDELAGVPRMDELRARLEKPLLEDCRAIAAMLE